MAVAVYLTACGGGGSGDNATEETPVSASESGGGGGSGDNATEETPVSASENGSSNNSTISGKLAQSYVRGATVWAEKLVNGVGNYQRDPGEADSVSSENGDFQLSGATGNFLLATSGGKKLDSQGNEVDAAPMLAPAPIAGQTSTNITPITTLVAFKPTLKEKLAQYGDWNADIASSTGVNGNLLRIAKIAESLSSAVSGGTSPLVTDFEGNLKSLEQLANQLNSTSEDLSDPTVLKSVSSTALSAILNDPEIVQTTVSADKKASLISSMEQAVEGIAQAIPADQIVVEDSETLAAVETVLEQANIDQTIQIKVTLGGSSSLQWAPVIRQIRMELSGSELTLTPSVDDDDTTTLTYAWTMTSGSLSISSPQQFKASISGFDESEITVSLGITDSSGSSDTASCTWQTNPTTCTFVE